MKNETPDHTYWTHRWKAGETGWDIGEVSTPIKEYVDQLRDRDLRILIPGAGNAYEAEYLFTKGFRQVTVLDISEYPLQQLKKRVPEMDDSLLVQDDFFNHRGEYDLIIEQTFLSALDPERREDYASKMYDLLASGGKLVGVLWGQPMNSSAPPYGGSIAEYQKLFSPIFSIATLEDCYNSIAPRLGAEVFIKLIKE